MTNVDMYKIISWSLRIGVVASALLLLIGIALSYSGIQSLSNQGEYILTIGIFVLFATPVARVAMSIASFAIERNWLYVLITSIVLANILIALFVIPALLRP